MEKNMDKNKEQGKWGQAPAGSRLTGIRVSARKYDVKVWRDRGGPCPLGRDCNLRFYRSCYACCRGSD